MFKNQKAVTLVQVRDFLGMENARNKANADLYITMLRRAFPGVEISVLVGHHICFEFNRDLNTENEIPSADALLFDHQIMGNLFGPRAHDVMCHLAITPSEQRDSLCRQYLEEASRPHTPWTAFVFSEDTQ